MSLLTSPFSLVLLLALLASWLFLYLLRPNDRPLQLLGRTFSDFETLSLLLATTFIFLFLSPLRLHLINHPITTITPTSHLSKSKGPSLSLKVNLNLTHKSLHHHFSESTTTLSLNPNLFSPTFFLLFENGK